MRDDTPPPCVSQASREEALEVFSAMARRPQISSACLASGTSWYHKMPTRSVKGPAQAQAIRDDHGSQHAIPLLFANRQKLPEIGGPGVHKAQSPG